MNKYKTKPIDYTGCHPVIAIHLKRGEAILCRVWDDCYKDAKEMYIYRFDRNAQFPYDSDGDCGLHAEPVEIKTNRVVLDPIRLMMVLTEEGYKPGKYSFKNSSDYLPFVYEMWALCGREVEVSNTGQLEVDGYIFKESWTVKSYSEGDKPC